MSNENREHEIKVIEAELKELRDELIAVSKEIKECKDGNTRKALFADKKTIHADIEEAKKHLSILKGEEISMPSDELDELMNEPSDDEIKEQLNTENDEK